MLFMVSGHKIMKMTKLVCPIKVMIYCKCKKVQETLFFFCWLQKCEKSISWLVFNQSNNKRFLVWGWMKKYLSNIYGQRSTKIFFSNLMPHLETLLLRLCGTETSTSLFDSVWLCLLKVAAWQVLNDPASGWTAKPPSPGLPVVTEKVWTCPGKC